MNRKGIAAIAPVPMVLTEEQMEKVGQNNGYNYCRGFMRTEYVELNGIPHVYADIYLVSDDADLAVGSELRAGLRWATDGTHQGVMELNARARWRNCHLAYAITGDRDCLYYGTQDYTYDNVVLGVECSEAEAGQLREWFDARYSQYSYYARRDQPKEWVKAINGGILADKEYSARQSQARRIKSRREALDDEEIRTILARDGRHVLPEDYLVYSQKGNRGYAYCSACEKSWTYEKEASYPDRSEWYKMNELGTCPYCGEAVREKPAGRYPDIAEKVHIVFTQRTETGIAMRFTECWRNVVWDSFMKIGRTKWSFADLKVFYMDEKHEDKRRKLFHIDKTTPIAPIKNGIHMYCGNLEEVTKGTIWEHTDLRTFSKHISAWGESVAYAVNLMRYPAYETLWKCGYENLVYSACWNKSVNINPKATRLHEVLQISREQLRRFQGINLSERELSYIQLERCYGKLTRDQLKVLTRYEQSQMLEILDYTGNYTRTLNYLSREGVWITEWKDTLQMQAAENCNMQDDIVLYPRKLREVHKKYVEIRNQREEEKLEMELRHIAEITDQVNDVMGYEGDQLLIRAPRTATEIKNEGQILHHCVWANGYHKRMAAEQTFILFLRKKEAPEVPFYTLEVAPDGSLRQWYGEYDRKPEIDLVAPFIEEYKKKVLKNMKWKPKTQEDRLCS